MSDATGRAEMERRLIEKSLQDDAFRQRLLEDPKAAVKQELGTRLPEQVRVVAVEETADTIYLVLPFPSRMLRRPASSQTGNSKRWLGRRRYPEWRHLQHRRMLGFHLPRPFRVRVARGVTPAEARVCDGRKGAVEGI